MSAILSNFMDNAVFVEFVDMAVVVPLMWLGWFTCSVLLRFVAERHWRQHLRAKVADADADMSEICTATMVSCPDSTIEDFYPPALDDAQTLRWLLESRGVFHASPGAWASAAGLEFDAASETLVDEDGEYKGAESDVDWNPTHHSAGGFQAMPETNNSFGMLFEHYALFQSEPGTWCPAQGDSDKASDEFTEVADDGCNGLPARPNVSSLPESHSLADAEQEISLNHGCPLEAFSVEADALVAEPLEDLEGASHSQAARAIFEQYSLFGAEPGTWSKDSDCSTVYSSESESVMAAEDITSDWNSEDEVDNDSLQDLFER